MKKALGQTVRDLKRGVNKKVLKVPSIEQKVLDATSNEPWGPHGSLLADVAQASRNYHEYQMIMSLLWKRINDTGKNWRHVYKALTVLEYLVAHGSERVIDDIREHSYQISTLSDFQYIDSGGRDQGNNVRKKSQSLVVLVNDKERIQEVRQKAASNRDKFRNTSAGSMYRPGSATSSGGYGDRYEDEGRYGNRDDEREGDRYGRDSEERYGRDGYRDDDYRGRGENGDDYQYGSRSRSADRDRDRSYEDDSQHSSRGSGAKADDHSQDGSTTSKGHERKHSEQNISAPPSYEEAVVAATRSPTYSERDGESSSAPKASSPTGASPSHATTAAPAPGPASPPAPASAQVSNNEVDGFDEFDPRGSFSAAPPSPAISNGTAPASSGYAEMDLLGSLSESYSSNSLALVPSNEPTMSPEANALENFSSGPTFAASSSATTVSDQPFGDPFGDGPFKALPSAENVSINSFNANSTQSIDTFGGAHFDPNYVPSGPSGVQPPTNPQFVQSEFSTPNQDFDILADILPPSSSFADTQTGYPPQTNQPASQSGQHAGFPTQPGQHAGFPTQLGQPGGYPTQPGQPGGYPSQPGQPGGYPSQPGQPGGYPSQQGQPGGFPTQPGQPGGFPTQPGQPGGFATQPGQLGGFATQPGQPGGFATQLGHPGGFATQLGQPTSFSTQPGQPAGFPTQLGQPAGFPTQSGQHSLHESYPLQSTEPVPQTGFMGHSMAPSFPVQAGQVSQMGAYSQSGQPTALTSFPSQIGSSQTNFQASAQQNQPNSNLYGAYNSQHNFLSQSGSTVPVSTQTSPEAPMSSAIVPIQSKDKFETKSTVWADTLSRGLVNLNISGSKTNPLADIGVDFDAINRKDKRMEKPTTAAVTSTVTMGKAMGSGSGMGRAGAGALRPPPNPMMGPGVNIAMTGGPGPGPGMGMGGYGVSQPMGRGMGMGLPNGNMGMGMNMGMGQGMGQNMGQGMGQGMPGGYNPMMGSGNYGQQPYNGGYR
ncbi:hypothetical protein RD792_004910 [Penstemon davidsonii]|uniref:ENTH domain-containing protein n=1 Tax=Penstemon davidsonii TaxID=160366 RepID=A0ABR0DJT3_9LAMI|nr:hypothetical protein RD792_004910 [Penstemon davidsonii]